MKSGFLYILLLISLPTYAQQDSLAGKKPSVYKKINPWVTYPIIVGGFVTNYFGVRFLKSKPGLDSATAVNLSPQDVNAFDRGASKQDPVLADGSQSSSTIILSAAAVLPLILGFDRNIRNDGVRVGLIYLETMSIVANAYSWGVGNIYRKRPYVYNPNENIARRTRQGSFNSFYCGHCAATSASSFFIAKVFLDYHPDFKLKSLVYTAALIPPAIVGYYRYRAGMHFPSDIIAGTTGGAIIGILIPQFHKNKNKNLSMYPAPGGLGLVYQF
ncbi:MAG: phosphatase PAP2 family protein [Cytophagaceae bacterium]|nr:phosphatase PAP2 family protein [Cytophagaceae bacterium]